METSLHECFLVPSRGSIRGSSFGNGSREHTEVVARFSCARHPYTPQARSTETEVTYGFNNKAVKNKNIATSHQYVRVVTVSRRTNRGQVQNLGRAHLLSEYVSPIVWKNWMKKWENSLSLICLRHLWIETTYDIMVLTFLRQVRNKPLCVVHAEGTEVFLLWCQVYK